MTAHPVKFERVSGVVNFEITPDGVLAAFWVAGLDTSEIAKRLSIRECVVANRLAVLRDGRAA